MLNKVRYAFADAARAIFEPPARPASHRERGRHNAVMDVMKRSRYCPRS